MAVTLTKVIATSKADLQEKLTSAGFTFSEDSFYLPTVYQTCCYTYGIFAYLYQYCCLHKKITRHFCITLKWLIIYKWLEIVVFCFFK